MNAQTWLARTAVHPLADGLAPAWASEWGEDRFGVFAGFTVGGVTQILRWIRPGRFTMGSPESEKGRWEDEGPAHAVTITQGFWLFETPCAQALWRAVVGDNPSRLDAPADTAAKRPVENVNWHDAKRFIEATNAIVPSLNLALPTEAEWEYAARAGSAGPIPGASLDAIAWHAGNSGRGETRGTHPVRGKAPNPWGLYDVIGNVLEWCVDGRRDYTAEDQVDPVGPMVSGAGRVLRGGSWSSDARCCRSAARDWDGPGARSFNIGFRPLARVQAPGRG